MGFTAIAKAIAHVANSLLQKARAGDTTSAIFYLKTQAGWRETTRIEPSDAAPDGRHRDTLKEMLDQIARRGRRLGVPEETIEEEAAAEKDVARRCLPGKPDDARTQTDPQAEQPHGSWRLATLPGASV